MERLATDSERGSHEGDGAPSMLIPTKARLTWQRGAVRDAKHKPLSKQKDQDAHTAHVIQNKLTKRTLHTLQR